MRKKKKVKLNTIENFKTVNIFGKLYSREISFINNAKKHKMIDRDGLCAKARKLLQNRLSFLCIKGVIETKDKYA